MSDILEELDLQIADKYKDYKSLYAKLSVITQEIAELENKRNEVIEKDGRRFIFRKPVIEIREFTKALKMESWINLEYEGFDVNKKDYITDTAMVVDVYCLQSDYASPVKFILVLSGYLSQEEYEVLNNKFNSRLPAYYIKGE